MYLKQYNYRMYQTQEIETYFNDMELYYYQINLQSVPSGDWFCAMCEAKKNDLPQWLLEIKGHKLLASSPE